MDEYIKRELALKVKIPHYSANGVEIVVSEVIPVGYIEKLPAADVRPVVHGHWIYEEPNGANKFKGAYWCDQCHQPEFYKRNYCPNCGADMREQPKEEQI